MTSRQQQTFICFEWIWNILVTIESDTVLTFSLALCARENMKTVLILFVEIYFISTQKKTKKNTLYIIT